MTSEDKKLYELWGLNLDLFLEDVMSHHLTSKTPEFHREIFELLFKSMRILLAAPRGFAKSSITSVFYPLHCALFGIRRNIHIISLSEGLAIEFLRKIKTELESNRVILKFWGDMRSPKWTENHIILKNGVEIKAKGAGGQTRGPRPDLIILDDIEDEESVASEDRRNKLRAWIFKACINSLTADGQFIWIGTIISNLCLLNETLEAENSFEKRVYKAYKDGIQEEGHELWPELWSHKKLQAKKSEIGSFFFATEYMNDPVSDENSPIRDHMIRYWDTLPDQISYVLMLDPAYSEEARSDYKTCVKVGIDGQYNRYLAAYVRTRVPQGEYINACINMYLEDKGKITALGVPKGIEGAFFASFKKRCEERKVYPPIVEIKNIVRTGSGVHRSKKMRIIATLQPLFESGKYYIHRSHTEARDELVTIGGSKHDDLVDPMASAEQFLTPTYVEPSTQGVDRYGQPLKDFENINYGDFAYGY